MNKTSSPLLLLILLWLAACTTATPTAVSTQITVDDEGLEKTAVFPTNTPIPSATPTHTLTATALVTNNSDSFANLSGRIALVTDIGPDPYPKGPYVGNSDLYILHVNKEETELQRYTEGLMGGSRLAWTPDGNKLSLLNDKYQGNAPDIFGHDTYLYVVDVDSSQVSPLMPSIFIDESSAPVWLDNEQLLITQGNATGQNELTVVHNSTGQYQLLISPKAAEIPIERLPALPIDRCCVAYYDTEQLVGGSRIRIVNPQGDLLGETKPFCDIDIIGCGRATNIVWTQDNKSIYFVIETNDFYSMQPDGTDIQFLGNIYPTNTQPAWSPDRTRIATFLGGILYVYSVENDNFGEELWRIKGRGGVVGNPQPSWSPDGHCLAYVLNEGDSQDLYIAKSDGSVHQRLTESLIISSPITWSPDSKCGE